MKGGIAKTHTSSVSGSSYNVPNLVVSSLLGRLPSGTNADGTTTVNLVGRHRSTESA